MSESIEWCQANITRQFPHFRFQWADVFNSRYNPKGTKKPEDYAFPGAFSSCAAIAATTSKIKIGTGVINPFTRHPVLIAMELAALDQLSGGRAILGLGASIRLWIEEQMGIRAVILPRRSEKDLVDVPEEVREELEIHLVDSIDEVLDLALEPTGTSAAA